MAIYGNALRQAALQDRLNDVLCACGHRDGDHRALPRDLMDWDPATGRVLTPNPDYKPMHVHCDHEGCDCVKVLS